LIPWIPRDDIAALLLKAKPSLTVKLLLDNLQITTEFETAMARKWATPVRYLIFGQITNLFIAPGASQFQEILNASAGTQPLPRNTISSAFEPHMSAFVDAQEKYEPLMIAFQSPLTSDLLESTYRYACSLSKKQIRQGAATTIGRNHKHKIQRR
jgi:hypothetical protein